jgi:hypothetical protein
MDPNSMAGLGNPVWRKVVGRRSRDDGVAPEREVRAALIRAFRRE